MEPDATRVRIASLRQDLETLSETLGASGMRRALADLFDGLVAVALAWGLKSLGHEPWLAAAYFLVRDLLPGRRSPGKSLLGLRVYEASSLRRVRRGRLLWRGLLNVLVLVPLAMLVVSFAGVAAGLLLSGLGVLVFLPRWSFLEAIGHDFKTGRTVVDRLAGTHVIEPRELDSLERVRAKITELEGGSAGRG